MIWQWKCSRYSMATGSVGYAVLGHNQSSSDGGPQKDLM